jgi:hypothetical protein
MSRIFLFNYFVVPFEVEITPTLGRFKVSLHFNGSSIQLSDISYATESEARQVAKDTLQMLSNYAQVRL